MLDGKTMPHPNLARLVTHLDVLLSKISETEQARSSGRGAAC